MVGTCSGIFLNVRMIDTFVCGLIKSVQVNFEHSNLQMSICVQSTVLTDSKSGGA